MRELVKEYVNELFEYDIALWLFMIVTWTTLAFITIFVLSQHTSGSESVENAESIGRVMKWPLYWAIGVVFGRPLLNVAGRRGWEWYKARGTHG